MTTTPLEPEAAEVEAHLARSIPESCLTVLHDLASGLTSKQIAARRHLAPSTVAMRISRANQHLGTNTAAQAVYEATMRGLLRGVPRP